MAVDLYNGSTAGDSEVLWALITRLNTDRAEKNKVVHELLRLHGKWAAISNLRSTWLEEIHNEAQNENNPSGRSVI